MKNWHTSGKSINKHEQGLITEDGTGRNVAVAYDIKDAKLIAASPKLFKALNFIMDNHLESLGRDACLLAYEAINEVND